jgi:hypothetical protein
MSDTPSLLQFLEPPESSYNLTRNLFLRSLGFIYFIAFLSLNRQVLALIGENGLLPASLFLRNVHAELGGTIFSNFLQLPSLFWFNCSDSLLLIFSYVGLFFSVLILAGVTNALLMAVQWFGYLSFVHIGQLFYGYGWETMTLEAGFLAIFICPIRSIRPYPAYPAPKVILWFYRWMLFRVMFGAGLIKIRGDECWRDLTCLVYHYETQPLPNPISWYLHQMPVGFHKAGCLFNHFVELIVPWFYFAPRKLRHIAGILTILFQFILILSGNLSFLNWLTIVIAIPLFDDAALSKIWKWRSDSWIREKMVSRTLSRASKTVLYALSALLICLSIYPILNMLSREQLMNASFDRLHLMNTYGAFGSVGRVRYEIILEGTSDDQLTANTEWKEFEFLAKPGDVTRRPAIIAPYQSRIDWQIWFAAMSDYVHNPWLVHFIYKLLIGDPAAIRLLRDDPFKQAPPRFIRAEFYEYHFTKDRSVSGAWWERKYMGHYLPPLSAEDPELHQYLKAYGWKN